ncbi:MAG TPA: LysM peptidoglycan-binding domain-containing protein [Acidimicrobiales bacterium]|nr:LysM peptidoglycan-binding domain-containing protein [Acidimicrobiales bacterium]
MSVADILAAFQRLEAAGRISGNDPAGLAALLATLGPGGDLPLEQTDTGADETTAWLTATTTFLNTRWTIRLTGRDADPGPDVALTLDFEITGQTTPWTFAQAFPDPLLPRSRRVADGRSGGLVLGPSVIAPLVVARPTLHAANDPGGAAPLPVLRGELMLRGEAGAPGSDVLAAYATYFGAPLLIDGTLDLAMAMRPVIDMRAHAPDASGEFGRVRLDDVGIRLWTAYPDPAPFPSPGAATSVALLYGVVEIPTSPPEQVELSAALLTGDNVWPLYVKPDRPINLSGGIQTLLALLGGSPDDFALPAGLAPLDAFGIAAAEFGVIPVVSGGPGLSYTSIDISSVDTWDPPVPYLLLKDVGVRWVLNFEMSPPFVTASLHGTMLFGAKTIGSHGAMGPALDRLLPRPPELTVGTDAAITVRLDLPEFALTAYNAEPIDINLGVAMRTFFGTEPPDVPKTLTVESFVISGSFLRKTLAASLAVTGDGWDVKAGAVKFSLDEIDFQVWVSQSSVSGKVAATGSVVGPGGGAPVILYVSAEYPGDGAWEFEGVLSGGPLKLVPLVASFFTANPPDWVSEVNVDLTGFAVRYSTAPGRPFVVKAALSISVAESLIGIPMKLQLAAEVERRRKATTADHMLAIGSGDPDPEMVLVGRLAGSFTINRVVIGAAVSFGDPERTYTFSITYAGKSLTATTAWDGQGAARHQVLVVRMTGVTLGDIVTYLVNLANPNADYRLDPPWSFLNTIDLGRFSLMIDPTGPAVAFRYDVQLNLAFASIQSVGVRFDRAAGNPAVKFELVGKLPGDPTARPIVWDAVNQAPPTPAGVGRSLFRLGYLGMGQHVTLKNLTKFTSINDVVAQLQKDMRPVTDPSKVPLNPNTMEFSPTSQWMFGIDATVMDTVTVKAVFHDPDLYGLILALKGPSAGSLAGLNIELLYKKVTNDIGVFHARLQIPDAFRRLQFGVVSVTLGIITVDVFTNGNFKVDFGFPHNLDFSVSFAVEAGYFNGRGGIYFGVLNGSTSTRVPQITNGTFSPVIELGVGLSIGVGRTFQKGPLSAGLYVNLIVVFEGALAWFHPADAGKSTEMYYWCRASAGIVGKLYGSVDFKIISASVSIEIRAVATLTLAAYQATLVELSLSVRASASVTFLFFSISFSFNLTLQTSFTIGSASTPPWRLASGQSGRTSAAAAWGAYVPRRRRPYDIAAITRQAFVASRADIVQSAGGYHLVFDKSAHVFPDGKARTTTLRLTPAFTVADVPVAWSPPAPPNPDPKYRVVTMVMADNAVSPSAFTIADTYAPHVAANAHAADATETTFNQLAEGMLRWSLDALGVHSPTAVVTLGQLEELVDQLAMTEAANLGFTWENVNGFLDNNLHFILSGTPTGLLLPLRTGGTPFPMLPVLQWKSDDLPPDERERDFSSYRPVNAAYEAEVLAYFEKLDPRPGPDRPSAAARLAAPPAPDESMAKFIFRDYFLMVARAAAQAAVDLLSSFPHRVEASDSLASIADAFPQTVVDYTVVPDDSVDHVAEHFGLSARELIALNPNIAADLAAAAPGSRLPITLGVTPEAVALANPGWAVVAGIPLHLGTLEVSIRAGDTLAAIARRCGTTASAVVDANRTTQPLLRTGASVTLGGFSYANRLGLSLDTVAAVYFVRLAMTADVPLADWYAEAIAALNPDVDFTPGRPLPATISVPSAYPKPDTPPPPPATWTTLPGDDLIDIAAYVALLQNPVGGSDFDEWRNEVIAANTPPPAAGVLLPPTAHAIVSADETLATFEARLALDAKDVADQIQFVAIIEEAPALQPLVGVTVHDVEVSTGPGLTLLTLAQVYELSLEDLAARIATEPGVLALDTKHDLQVHGVPGIGLERLAATLHGPVPMATISGEVSRFMLFGLRLPEPDPATETDPPMVGLYELVGQQVVGPPAAPPAEPDPPAPVLTITFTKSEEAEWLAFAATTTVADADTVVGLTQDHAAFADLNPAFAQRVAENGGTARAGMVVHTAVTDHASLVVTAADVAKYYPATSLVPAIQGTVTPLPLFREVPVLYSMAHVVPWQTTDAPLLPTASPPASTAPSLWAVPDALAAKASGGESTSQYRLEQTVPQAGPTAPRSELAAYAWATVLGVSVRRVPGVAGTVEVLGADAVDRQRLAAVLRYLGVLRNAQGEVRQRPEGEAAHVKVLWQLPPTPGMGPGLTSTPLDRSSSFIVQANLSTDSRRGPLAARVAASDATHFASLSNVERFLTLLWECSVVGGGGYWLHYEGAGSPVPDSIFDQDGLAQLSILVQLESQSTLVPARNWPVRRLFDFNNCAVVGDAIDPGAVAIVVVATDPVESRREASVLPGQVGFELDLTRPDATTDDAESRLQQLYNLVGYRLGDTLAFAGSAEGRPLAPEVKRVEDEHGNESDDENTWHLSRVLPISRFAREHLAALPTAPVPGDDPYAGISASGGEPPAPASAAVELWMHDVLGNASAPAPPEGGYVIPVRYTDPLIGVSAWPATTSSFVVYPGLSGPTLRIELAFQAVAYQPGSVQAGKEAADKAARDTSVLAAVYYQLMQPDVTAALLTSLQQMPGAGPDVVDVPVDILRRFVIGSHALLGTVARLDSFRPDPATSPTLDAVCAFYGVDYDGLGEANASVALSELIAAAEVAVPQFHAFRLDEHVAGFTPDPAVVLRDADNTVLALTVGVELRTPDRHVDVPADPLSVDAWLPDLRCTLATLVNANRTTPGLLSPGFVFSCNGVEVHIAATGLPSDATLDGVQQAFAGQGAHYDAADIVAMNSSTAGMFRAGATVRIDGYVVGRDETLAANGSLASVDELADRNGDTVNLFPMGTPVLVGAVDRAVPAGMALDEFAAIEGITPGSLLRHNGTAPLAPATQLAVPGMAQWPADIAELRVPYAFGPGDSLDDVAGRFLAAGDGDASVALARVNADMPGTIGARVTITADGRSVTTETPVSFAGACALFSPSLSIEELAAAIGQRTDVVAFGALIVCPPAVLPRPPSGAVSPDTAAHRYHLLPVSLLAANAGTAAMITAGVDLLAFPPTETEKAPPVERTVAGDSLNAVVERFRRRGVVTSIDSVVVANTDVPFLAPGTVMLLPPATAVLEASLGMPEWRFPDPVFPIRAWVQIARDFALVDADLRGTPDQPTTAVRDRTLVPVVRTSQPAQGNAMTLEAFAHQLESAVGIVRVATGKTLASDAGSDTDVWAVVFDEAGIQKVSVTPPVSVPGIPRPQPRCFAIRPLANALVARSGVTIHELDVATGALDPTGADANFQGVDLEVWARGLLADIELLLSPAYLVGAHALNPDALDSIIDAKKTLAAAVATGLDYVLADAPRPVPDSNRLAAVEALRQALLGSLSSGYATAAVIQYETDVASVWSSTYARLSGKPVPSFASTDPALRTATVSNGKVSLTSGQSQVSFLINVPDVQAHAALAMSLDYKIVEFEFDIAAEIDGYERSNWLAFVTDVGTGHPPALQIDLGEPSVPLPLRAYPALPTLVEHSARVPQTADTLAAALHWHYDFRLQHQSAQQDEIGFEVTFNQGGGTTIAAQAGDDLFANLAQYAAVSAPLLGIIGGLVRWEQLGPAERDVVATALATFDTLVGNVAGAWETYWTPKSTTVEASAPAGNTNTRPPLEVYEYAMTLQADGSRERYTGLKLVRVRHDGPGTIGWPKITCISTDGTPHELHIVDPTVCGCRDDCACYQFVDLDNAPAAYSLLEFDFEFPEVHIAAYQSATARAWVTRNATLLGDAATNPQFVYRTAAVSYPKPIVPFINLTDRIPIDDWATAPLQRTFDEILAGGPANPVVAVGARYGYDLTGGAQPVEAYIPVMQSTAGSYQGATTVGAVELYLSEWHDNVHPESEGGLWALWISLYSSVDPELDRPVLQLKRLVSRLA